MVVGSDPGPRCNSPAIREAFRTEDHLIRTPIRSPRADAIASGQDRTHGLDWILVAAETLECLSYVPTSSTTIPNGRIAVGSRNADHSPFELNQLTGSSARESSTLQVADPRRKDGSKWTCRSAIRMLCRMRKSPVTPPGSTRPDSGKRQA